MTDTPKRGRPPMTDEHRAAMSIGMIQGRAIRQYLELVQSDGFRNRGPRAKSPEQLLELIANTADPIERLKLRPQLRAAVEIDMNEADLKKSFLEHVGPFSEKYGVSYADWREEGVPASVLKEAGIQRSTH